MMMSFILWIRPLMHHVIISRIFTQGNFNDYETVLNFGKKIKIFVTIEIEHVNADALAELEKQGIKVVPNANIIKTIQQKSFRKNFIKLMIFQARNFRWYGTVMRKIIMPLPFVQKMNTGGYDGKGVQVIKTEEDYQQLWTEPSVIESLVDIEKNFLSL